MRIAAAISVVSLLGLGQFVFAAEPASKLDPEHAAKMKAGLDVFQKDVRQVLIGRCVKCHGGDKKEGGLDIVTREALLKGGTEGPSVVAGKPNDSRLVKLIKHDDEPAMPEDGAKLPANQIAAIAKWIELGAPYDKPLIDKNEAPDAWVKRVVEPSAKEFWAFQPLKVVAPPQTDGDRWSVTPVDRFVLAKLKEKGLTPASPTSKRVLIRRAYFDLIGLPPPADEVERFVADDDPQAYEKLLDRLLDNPHYGERWGRYWLDVARFAESHGFEQDYDRPFAFHYRDFVIKALNQDMPYDQFVKWQVAGDEFAPDNPLAMMATGFLGAGVFPTQITKNEVERSRYDALDDMTATVGSAFLALSLGCARCHDHKYDPIPSGDYYRLASTFTTTVRSEIDLNLDPAPYRVAKEAWDKEHAPLAAALAKFEAEQLPARLQQWEAAGAADLTSAKWVVLDVAEMKSAGGATLTKQDDGSILASGTNPDVDTYTFVAHTEFRGISGVRLEALSHPSFVKGGPGRAGNGNIALTDFRVTAKPKAGGDATPVVLQKPIATFEQPGLFVRYTIDDDKKSAWAVDPQFGKDHAAVYETATDVGFEGGTTFTFTLAFNNNQRHNIGRARLLVTTAARPHDLLGNAVSQEIVSALKTPRENRTAKQTETLLKWYRTRDEEWQKLNRPVQEHLAKKPKPATTKVMVVSEGFKPIRHHTQGADYFNETYYTSRGDVEKKVGVAPQSFLQVLMNAPEQEKRWLAKPPEGWRTSYRRTGLANWLTDTEYGPGQLVARVMANRIWQHHFGQGIVSTPNDFGAQGQRPTHPELLDWLAAEMIRGGWRLKSMHKRLMTSAVYTQGSAFDEAKSKLDPQNQFLWRFAPRRLEAESIRDAMLAVSGTLDRTQFGPGTLDEGHKRRSIYFMIKRSKLIPMMQLFDSPEPLVSVGARPSTTIAPQALMFLNNPQVRGYALAFGKQLATSEGKPREFGDAVRYGYLSAVGRPPTEAESSDAVAFLDQQAKSYADSQKPNARELALADFCQVLMSLNEFVYVE